MTGAPGRRLALAAYSALLRLAVPLYALRLLWRSRRERGYGRHLGERFGLYDGPVQPGALWLHAVSLGETRAAAPLVEALRALRPGLRMFLTHGTATGRDAGLALLRPGDAQVWLPWDTPGAVRRFLVHHRPIAGVLMETEIWPNLMHEARRAGVPMLLANARLSVRSRRRGDRVDALLRPAFESLSAAFAQTEDDAERLRDAGAAEVSVLGNTKYDLTPDPEKLALGRAWKSSLGSATGSTTRRAVVLAAVTREGEEAMLLGAWPSVAEPRPLLVIVPRHPQRFDAVAAAVAAAGLSLSRRSAWPAGGPPPEAARADVWLGDSMLEMPAWYALADVALLGGSFAPLGGQNLIEAAACGCPLVMGPHTFNFAAAAELALQAGAALRVDDMAAAVAASRLLLADPQQRADRSTKALAFARRHRGAAMRMAERVVDALPPPRPGP